MIPQFVDFDADGHVDIFAATFDGSPHVALGSPEGFLEPKHVLDPEGGRVLLSEFWNYEAEKWDETRDTPKGHCTSALAFDWDADGDLDILMGDYRTGRLFRRMNEGTAAKPDFSSPNIPVEVDGEPFEAEDGLSSHELADWDGDGLKDLICGGYGDAYGSGPGAGIWWYRNTGKPGAPRFAAAKTLVPRSTKGTRVPVRPDTGLYLTTVDWDGDGHLDIVVGGYSHWTPEPRELTPEEEARADELETQIAEQQAELQKLYAGLAEIQELTEEDLQAATIELFDSDAFKALSEGIEEAQEELDCLRPGDKREAFVWVYQRRS